MRSSDSLGGGVSAPQPSENKLRAAVTYNVPEAGSQALHSPEDFWTVALGSGYRGTIDQLDPDARERVRQVVVSGLREQKVAAIETNVIYAVASKR